MAVVPLAALYLGHVLVVELLGLGLVAGCLGAIAGIGGGVLIVPALVLGLGFDMRTAVATSLVGVVATSTAAAASYVAQGRVNMRLAMTLEVATTAGGIAGGLMSLVVPAAVLSGVFGAVMLPTAVLMARGRSEQAGSEFVGGAVAGEQSVGRLGGRYEAGPGRTIRYRVRRLPLGLVLSWVAGAASGLLGVGGGFIKVPAMNLVMGVPIEVAAATSNLMIGVTALSSLVVYLGNGFVRPAVAAPVALGVVVGALVGSSRRAGVPARAIQLLLAAILFGVAIEMLLKAAGVGGVGGAG